MNGFEIFSGSSNPKLAKKIAKHIESSLGDISIKRFPNNHPTGELHVKYEDNIRGKNVFLIQSLSDPVNEHLMELLIMIDAAKRASAADVIPVIPYYGYARQDRKDQPRVPITAKLLANLLQAAGATKIITVDLHAHQIQGFFDIPVDHLFCSKMIANYLTTIIDPNETMLVAPDEGAMKLASLYNKYIPEAMIAMISKNRTGDSQVEAQFIVGDVEGKDCVLVDDLTSTASTLIAGAEKLKSKGAKDIYAAVSHCCLTDKGYENLKKGGIKKLISTNTIPSRKIEQLKILNVASLIGESVMRCHDGRSIASLFETEEDDD
jgi:ribose-phosphate pyrophosphokinase